MLSSGSGAAHREVLQCRERGANGKLAETTQKRFLLMISASGDKAGILTPLRASCLGLMSVLQLWTGEGGPCQGCRGWRQVWAGGIWQCHGSPVHRRCWSAQAAAGADCERSARVMNPDRGVEGIRGDLSLQTGKYLPGVAGSRLCMPQGRFCLCGSFLMAQGGCPRAPPCWDPLLAQRLCSARVSAGVWVTQEEQKLPFFVAGICIVETEHLDCWGE